MLRSLNIIGCGRVGRALGTLLQRSGSVGKISVLNATPDSSARAAAFVPSATAVGSLTELPPADLWMIATPDSQMAVVVAGLAPLAALHGSPIVFHVSGSSHSGILEPLRARGASIASLHPIRSIADPDLTIRTFGGTACSIEGDAGAVQLLEQLAVAIGACPFEITRDAKLLCHAGHVFASNYLVVVLDLARQLYRHAGVSDASVESFLPAIMRGTVENVVSLGTTAALTGPVVRGEVELLQEQATSIMAFDTGLGEIYSSLAHRALEIAARRGELSGEALERVRRALGK